MIDYPTPSQRRALWSVLTFFALVGAGALALALIVLVGKAVQFLQPALLPFAIAGVLAFLLEPTVRFISVRTRLSRTWSVLVVFLLLGLGLGVLGLSVVPRIYRATVQTVQDLPAFAEQAQRSVTQLFEVSQRKLDKLNLDRLLPPTSPLATTTTTGGEGGTAANAPAGETAPATGPGAPPGSFDLKEYVQSQVPVLSKQAPALFQQGLGMVGGAMGGVFGGLGIVLEALLIPVYLFFLLVEGAAIAKRWQDYLPLRDSPVKVEVVSVMTEINGYLVAFFRGQLLVSTINGILIGLSLWIFVKLKFSLLIGAMVVVLTFIPYIGIILCYIPAMLVAGVQYGDWWHPFLVFLIMFTVQNIEGFLIAPKIVGDSTGLHPLTVIVSIFAWTLLLKGPIGAILAVPLTASLKVLMRRYVWERAKGRARLQPAGDVAALLASDHPGASAGDASAGNQKVPVDSNG